MREILNAARLQAARVRSLYSSIQTGSVSSFDPNTWRVKVTLQPDSVKTGWMPLLAPWVGDGWGMFAPPNIGDSIIVGFINAQPDAAIAIGRFFDANNVPLPVQSGEFWLVHAQGQSLKLYNSGQIAISDGNGASITLDGQGNINSAGNWNHDGPLTATGIITSDVDVVAALVSLVNHLTTLVQAGSSNSGPPLAG